MNEKNNPFESYLTGRAAEIDLPAAGTGTIAERARARRRRRRSGSAALLGAAVLLGGAVIGQGLRSSDDDQQVESYGAAVGSSELDWTMVDVDDGLGWARGIVRADSGRVYALSTAAGDGSSPSSYRRVLYASADGSEWSEVAMADDLKPSGIAASGSTIYAVGTGAGGGVVRVASSDAPEDGWTTTDLPLDLEAEAAGLPGRLYVAGVEVASARGTTVVAATVQLSMDTEQIEALLSGEENPTEWYPDREGMVRWVCEGDGTSLASTTTAPASPTSMPGVELTEDQLAELDTFLAEQEAGLGAEREALAAGSTIEGESCDSATRQVKTWDELDVDPAVGQLVVGEARLFSESSEGAGDPEGPPSFGYRATVAAGWGVQVLAGDDGGFWVLSPSQTFDGSEPHDATEAIYSPDGFDWSGSPSTLGGNRVATGLFDGAAHVVTVNWPGGTVELHRLGSGSV